jgi:hypothetical protein
MPGAGGEIRSPLALTDPSADSVPRVIPTVRVESGFPLHIEKTPQVESAKKVALK